MSTPYPDESPIYSPDWEECEWCEVLIPLDSQGFRYQHTCSRHVTVTDCLTDRLELDEWWRYCGPKRNA